MNGEQDEDLRRNRCLSVFFRVLTPIALLTGLLAGCAAPTSYMGIDLSTPVDPRRIIEYDIQRQAQRAKSGNKWSQFVLGLHFEEGVGVEKNIATALKLYAAAGSGGSGKLTIFIPQDGIVQAQTVNTGKPTKGLRLAEYKYALLSTQTEDSGSVTRMDALMQLAATGNDYANIDLARQIVLDKDAKQGNQKARDYYQAALDTGFKSTFQWPEDFAGISKIEAVNPVAVMEYCKLILQAGSQDKMCKDRNNTEILERLVRLDQMHVRCAKKVKNPTSFIGNYVFIRGKKSSYRCLVKTNEIKIDFTLSPLTKKLIWHFWVLVNKFESNERAVSYADLAVMQLFFKENYKDLHSRDRNYYRFSFVTDQSLLTVALKDIFLQSYPYAKAELSQHDDYWAGLACPRFRLRKRHQYEFVGPVELAICDAQRAMRGRKIEHPSEL
ncbi:MAG: hypothetical protein V7679_08720 [Parasphingorhabdus sp.]